MAIKIPFHRELYNIEPELSNQFHASAKTGPSTSVMYKERPTRSVQRE
jgi:hypothetical protein